MVTEQPKLKSGILTTEFWMAIGTSVTGILVAIGVLTPTEADQFVQALVSVVGGLLTLASMIVYIYGRIKLKSEYMQNSTRESDLLKLDDSPTSSEAPLRYVK